MYVETMTPDEIVEEFKKDYGNVLVKTIKCMLPSKEYKNIRRANFSTFPVYLTYPIKTDRGNSYYVRIKFPDKKSVLKITLEEFNFTPMPIIKTSYGGNSVNIVTNDLLHRNDKWILHTFRPHLFARFKERMGYTNIDGMKLVKKFFDSNTTAITNSSYRETDNNEVYVSCKDGCMLGVRNESENVIHLDMKTFISNETMKEGYKSSFNQSEECIKLHGAVDRADKERKRICLAKDGEHYDMEI